MATDSVTVPERACTARPLRFLLLLAQLVGLAFVIRLWNIESRLFADLVSLTILGFAVHYWLPLAWRYRFFVGYSIACAFVILGVKASIGLLAIGLLIYGLVRLPVSWWARITLVVLLGIALMVARTLVGEPWVTSGFWPLVGSIFMFRTIVYIYDVRHSSRTPRLIDFLGYFYLLPNYYFLLFPVVDHQTFLVARDRKPLDDCAQTGIRWIVRGIVQLILYRVIVLYMPDPANMTTIPGVAGFMVMTYLLYLRVSGQFHIAIGMIHLFGIDLPETHRKYLLASSIADFWRRINIYWKDFILKIFYLPIFFRLRKGGEVRAAVIATSIAFLATWALHAYQTYWLLGVPLLTLPDTLFWAILGFLMVLSSVHEMKNPAPAVEGVTPKRVFGVLVTFVTITILWSLWNAPSLDIWFRMVSLRGGGA
ncbi:MAG: hypothetical protein MK082_11545 [Phycisphaerales bacterium]|nr:hypothetical protein [Phycisphaerales bacterium]